MKKKYNNKLNTKFSTNINTVKKSKKKNMTYTGVSKNPPVNSNRFKVKLDSNINLSKEFPKSTSKISKNVDNYTGDPKNFIENCGGKKWSGLRMGNFKGNPENFIENYSEKKRSGLRTAEPRVSNYRGDNFIENFEKKRLGLLPETPKNMGNYKGDPKNFIENHAEKKRLGLLPETPKNMGNYKGNPKNFIENYAEKKRLGLLPPRRPGLWFTNKKNAVNKLTFSSRPVWKMKPYDKTKFLKFKTLDEKILSLKQGFKKPAIPLRKKLGLVYKVQKLERNLRNKNSKFLGSLKKVQDFKKRKKIFFLAKDAAKRSKNTFCVEPSKEFRSLGKLALSLEKRSLMSINNVKLSPLFDSFSKLKKIRRYSFHKLFLQGSPYFSSFQSKFSSLSSDLLVHSTRINSGSSYSKFSPIVKVFADANNGDHSLALKVLLNNANKSASVYHTQRVAFFKELNRLKIVNYRPSCHEHLLTKPVPNITPYMLDLFALRAARRIIKKVNILLSQKSYFNLILPKNKKDIVKSWIYKSRTMNSIQIFSKFRKRSLQNYFSKNSSAFSFVGKHAVTEIFSSFSFSLSKFFSLLPSTYTCIEKTNFYLDKGHKYSVVQPISNESSSRTLSPIILSKSLLSSFHLYPYELLTVEMPDLYPIGRVINDSLFYVPNTFGSTSFTSDIKEDLTSYWSKYMTRRRLYRYRLRFYLNKSTLWKRRSYRGRRRKTSIKWFLRRAKAGLKMMKQRLLSLPIFPYFLYYPIRFINLMSISISVMYNTVNSKVKSLQSNLLVFNKSFNLSIFEFLPFITHYVKHIFRQYIIVPQSIYDYYYQSNLYNSLLNSISMHLSVLHHYPISYHYEAFLGNLYRPNMFYFFNNKLIPYIVHSDFVDPIVLTKFLDDNKIKSRVSDFFIKPVTPFSTYLSSDTVKTTFSQTDKRCKKVVSFSNVKEFSKFKISKQSKYFDLFRSFFNFNNLSIMDKKIIKIEQRPLKKIPLSSYISFFLQKNDSLKKAVQGGSDFSLELQKERIINTSDYISNLTSFNDLLVLNKNE